MRAWRLGLVWVVASCSKPAVAPPTPIGELQMNDLSVLLPLPRNQTELAAALSPSSPAQGGALLPEAIYNTGGGGGNYDDLSAVAFRLDPCFGQLGAITDPSACHAQLRVVFQPLFMLPDGSFIAEDMAVHAFYALTADQLVDAVNEVMTARIDDNGDADLGPLAPHPVIVREGLAGPLAMQLDAIIAEYAGAADLIRFTTFTVDIPVVAGAGADVVVNGPDTWQLDSFDVGGGSATPRAIPTLPADTTFMSVDAGGDPLTTELSPMTTSNDNIALLANFTQASQATKAQRQAGFDAALRIENPHDNSPDTIDCASCHMADPARVLVGEQLGMTSLGNSNAFVPDTAIPAADLAQTTQVIDPDGDLNIHAFSYLRTYPMINQRVINETAANLAYIATLLITAR